MLRSAVYTVYLAAAFAALLTREFSLLLVLVILAAIVGYAGRGLVPDAALEKQLNRLAARTVRMAIGLSAAIALAVLLSGAGTSLAADWAILAAVAVVPGGLLIALSLAGQLQRSLHFVQHNTAAILRSGVAAAAAATALVLLSLVGYLLFHINPAVTAAELLLVTSVAFALPLIAISSDFHPEHLMHKKQALPRYSLSWKLLKPVLFFGSLAGAFAYASYLFFYLRINLDPAYIATTLPQYHQATAAASLALLTCLFVYVLFERADNHHRFFTEHLSANKRLLAGFAAGAAVLATASYVPLLQTVFGTAALGFLDWVAAIYAACLFTLARLLQRHTRKHTRRAVVELSGEVRS